MARPSHCARKISPVSDDCLEVRDLDEHEEYRIKHVTDDGKRPIVVLVYCIL